MFSAMAAHPHGIQARFPSWMWCNLEVEKFVDWLHRRNVDLAPKDMAAEKGSWTPCRTRGSWRMATGE